ncbi:MAG TPA: hypothetical protein GYA07_01805 [Verrucomicrobia bacterium]|nr:hypothetical protein [Verrucomicrobiota bacterium]
MGAILFLAWPGASLPCSAQTDLVTISAPEFQRMVYSAHLMTQLAEKPELEPALELLLEIARRNPNADPNLLSGAVREATLRFRTNTPPFLLERRARDEMLAAFLDAFRSVPARTHFNPAYLTLLQRAMRRDTAPAAEPQAGLIHSGSQHLLGATGMLAARQALVDACVQRAARNPAFRAALDAFLAPEVSFATDASPGAIINSTNSPLLGNPTMQTLLALSTPSGLAVSREQLMTLFTNETRAVWDIVNTNLAVQREINRHQAALLEYLSDHEAMEADNARLAAARQGQAQRLACSSAAVLVQSKLIAARDPLIPLPGQMQGCMEGLHKITDGVAAFTAKDATTLGKIAASGNILSGALGIFDLLFGGESPEEAIAREIGNVKILIGDLATNMNYRFDRVDLSLAQIYQTLNEQFAELGNDVDAVRLALLDVQTELFRIERNLATFTALTLRNEMVGRMNNGLGYEATAGAPMAYDLYNPNYVVMATDFYTYAYNTADDEALSRNATLPFGDEYFHSQLSAGTNVYAETLNYLKRCLRQRLLLPGFTEQPVLANPQDWNAGAGAFLQLALENPGYFRRYDRSKGYPEHLDNIIAKGRDLANFFRSLVFTGADTNINWPLYDALKSFYLARLTAFTNEVRSAEQLYAADHGSFALDTWRRWCAQAPRLAAASTELLQVCNGYVPPIPADCVTGCLAISSGAAHSVALKADGTVAAWGRNLYGPATNIPPGLSNVVAIAAGFYHSLALKNDGTVVAWGDNEFGQVNTPANATNVVAVAGGEYSMALTADGTILVWGNNDWGQHHVPASATNVVAIAAGMAHSLALKADGTVVTWGAGAPAVPPGLNNVVAIAAGYGHSLALRADGTVVAWGQNSSGEATAPADLSNVVAISAGRFHSMALRADGTVVAWGDNGYGQCNIPPSATNVIAVSGAGTYSLLLSASGIDAPATDSASFLVRAQIPSRVTDLLLGVNDVLLTELDLDLHSAAVELSGAKALFQAVLELGMPYTLERDDVLRGFLYGSEPLADLESARAFFQSECRKLQARPIAAPLALAEVADGRFQRFSERLDARLADIANSGQPEIPRMVGHTLRLLTLLRDAWAETPRPAIEILRSTNSVGITLYGEPYSHHALEHSPSLGTPQWLTVTQTNLHSEELVILPISAGTHWFRVVLP